NVAEVSAAMVICHSTLVLFGTLANELEGFARSKMLVGIAAAIDAGGRFAPELRDPARVGPHAAFREQGQGVGPALALLMLRALVTTDHRRNLARSMAAGLRHSSYSIFTFAALMTSPHLADSLRRSSAKASSGPGTGCTA